MPEWERRRVYAQPTGTAGDHALPPFLRRQTRHEVVRATDLEAEYLLEVFSLQPDFVSKLCAEVRRVDQWCFLEDVIDF